MVDPRNIPITAIETVSGRLVDLADVQVDDIISEDIAWALSREPRFGGHTFTELPYTVGQHSVHVSKLCQAVFEDAAMQKEFMDSIPHGEMKTYLSLMFKTGEMMFDTALYGLIHDASEAYLRDLPSPVKSLPGLREAYLAKEAEVMKVVFKKYGLDSLQQNPVGDLTWKSMSTIVHWCDLYARTVEAYHFMPSRGAHWKSHQKVTLLDLHKFEMPKPGLVVYQEFLERLRLYV